MSTIEESIEVNVPVSTAYNQWTQFEEFPRFMEGVEEIRQVSDSRMHWKTRIAGVEREFDAEITEQHPDHRIAWRSVEGTDHAGVVTFHRISDDVTRIMLQLDSEPEGAVEKIGDALGILKRRVKGDLGRFKEMMESRGAETGAWRGDIEGPGEAGGRFAPGSPTESTDTTVGGTSGTA
ncbi:MAG: SRPBCC family protein [Actinomycetota bacterium]|nr:SRPBCC family protein [Actinomycetota bacterium]